MGISQLMNSQNFRLAAKPMRNRILSPDLKKKEIIELQAGEILEKVKL